MLLFQAMGDVFLFHKTILSQVFWCIIMLIHGTPFRVQCLNHLVHMVRMVQ